ncbi:inositol monophosphatase family protein [Demequina muriae]|uniref:Inositol monophosphatase family protein n=1 Tax=Demequina muriae TaxID=3051664 RepID=A0ABT8GHX8_9MICO|nr:inositol monophosphatase family protein [Demequina sp. EGI L300058]MDN4481037.1 inositol monophosphatase family protein [Demequina sp. EGI L300058]
MQPAGPYAADLALALSIADEVDALTLPASTGHFEVELKADDSPVTAIDREAERIIRARVASERPADAFVGEEYGSTSGGARQWVVDPIDGTKNFVRGVPVWATLIALIDDGVPVMGVVSAPALARRWFAAAGDGAWRGRTVDSAERIGVSTVDDLTEASLSYSSLSGWDERGLLPAFLGLADDAWRTRAYGDFWSYMLVAEGVVDAAMEPELELYDMAALVPIVTEAGGQFTSLAGEPGPFGGDALATNGLLHAQIAARLQP